MHKVFVIAEAGVNHNGDLNIAKKLVDKAVEAGADAVKFQTFRAERLASRYAPKAEYQLETTDSSESQVDMLKKLELTPTMHLELIDYCRKKNILFLSTPFEIESLEYLLSIGLKIIKLPSGEITNYPLLKKAGESHVRIILSTGMSTLQEVKDAVKVLQGNGCKDLTLLHCNTQYPTPYEDVNLNAMLTLHNETGLPVGYSDHTKGIDVPIAAVAMGASVIEKHFTLDRDMEGPDHKASLEPDELKKMVLSIRHIEDALGDGVKRPSESEIDNISIVRKSIVASKSIKEGEIFSEDNLTTKRPGTGISPMEWNEIIGTKAIRDFEEDELIEI